MTQPLALRKLGMFVRDAYVRRDPSKRMGMVIVGTSNSEGNCLVVGITPAPGSGSTQVGHSSSFKISTEIDKSWFMLCLFPRFFLVIGLYKPHNCSELPLMYAGLAIDNKG
jgi:hypothetical protein